MKIAIESFSSMKVLPFLSSSTFCQKKSAPRFTFSSKFSHPFINPATKVVAIGLNLSVVLTFLSFLEKLFSGNHFLNFLYLFSIRKVDQWKTLSSQRKI
jgi:hypothetical protein